MEELEELEWVEDSLTQSSAQQSRETQGGRGWAGHRRKVSGDLGSEEKFIVKGGTGDKDHCSQTNITTLFVFIFN